MWSKGRATAQAVSHRPLTEEAWVHAWVSPCGFCGGQCGIGTGFSPSCLVFPVNIITAWLSMLIYRSNGGHSSDTQSSTVMFPFPCKRP